jgi:hypothetical protein
MDRLFDKEWEQFITTMTKLTSAEACF